MLTPAIVTGNSGVKSLNGKLAMSICQPWSDRCGRIFSTLLGRMGLPHIFD